MSAEQINALVITPPMQNEIFAVQSGAASSSSVLPPQFDGAWITIRCLVADVSLNFSVGAGVANAGSFSAGVPIGPAANRGITLSVGSEVPYYLGRILKPSAAEINLNHISAGAGVLEFWVSSGPV